ncbi:hypothetical protein K1T71_012844 [Dendrolimus kikuchii]|uniref:Uncharacterized protein n=1 Tax=Dendrolimus kikuchii TaxID=765133 RepID=A0ACC1CIM1_9NEOP|nr:hypothetical protein K1T71_012844 [Dendrolimus kikuchii]
MCNRNTDNVPQGFLDILDAEDESDSDYELIQDESEHLDCPDSVQTSFVLVDKTLQAGSYMLVDGVLKPAPESMLIEEDFSFSNTDGEEDEAHSEVSWASSPVTLRGSLQPDAGDEPVASCSGISFPCGSLQFGADDEPVASSARRRSGIHRRGIRGRRGRGNCLNSGSSGESVGLRRSVWSRGKLLVECYVTDEDLPQPLREEIVMLNNTERTIPQQEIGDIHIKRESEDANDDYASIRDCDVSRVRSSK